MAEIIAQLRKEVATMVGGTPDEVDDQADLSDMGVDSVRIMSLVEQVLAAGYPVDYADLAAEPKLASWAKLLGDSPHATTDGQ
ncbi:MAG: phosphopantetheine-binding protein [Kocuria sp.]|nr:phosphopantetheine-binding protein [Kocuria sp.]